ncbi:UDP-glycosyltransferase 84A4 [Phytophthora nicotianae]|uniref:UDP-glycosyltransferase 84A4 n=1 Tax=Phytophthora nicotianae TaxID=4792 RepID=A0A0W8DP52_PHYNI|nr:UDP-glycosyltransferase 84A4 [Phytophthora nicotianae]
MGLFGKKGNGSRVAEGGGGALAAASPLTTASPLKGKSGDLELFGADSDDSDDDATIDRYAKDGGDEEMDEKEAAEAEKRKVAVLNSKLPDLGISISAAKAMRIFRKCDTDGGGEIDLTEFKMAMFAVDPVSGNPLGFSPSTLLGPRDAFELFDEDGTGQIDELEFADSWTNGGCDQDVLEYFGMDVSDEKQEKIFKKYDKDKSGHIDYQEFRSMWIKLVDVREELTKRGVEVPKHTRLVKLQQMLETILDEEEAREAAALEEAKRFLQRQRDKELREQLGRKAIVRAEDELAAALDAAGQVYIIGSGKYDQFIDDPVTRDEDLFPGFKAVSEIWSYRVNPIIQEVHTIKPKAATTDHKQAKDTELSPEAANKSAPKNQEVKNTDPPPGNQLNAPASKYVRRRVENKRWKFQSPPRLNKQTISETKILIRAISREMDNANERNDGEKGAVNSPTNSSEVVEITHDENNQEEEELAKLFFENREFVRSLRFRSTTLMTNTGPLWGKSVVQGAISDSVAFAVTSSGSVFSWGGRSSTWEASNRRVSGFDSDSDDSIDDTGQEKDKKISEFGMQTKVTPRSALQKMCTPEQLEGLRDPDVEAREEVLLEIEARQNEENQRYERLKRVAMYYDVWEPPPSNATRLLFMEQVVLPKIEYEQLVTSGQLRGLEFQKITKMDLSLALGECFELEIEVKGEAGHAAFKEMERVINIKNVSKRSKRICSKRGKTSKPCESRHAKEEEDARARVIEKINRALLGGQVYVCGGATALSRYVLSWERIPQLDGVGVRQVSCGGSHTAAVSSYGELYTWGRNYHGCTGHDASAYRCELYWMQRRFIEKPELLKCLHVEPYNLALGKICRQISIYNEQGPQLAVNGDIEGALATCTHTQMEDKPWWEVDLGQPAVIEKIRSSAFELFRTNKRMTEWILPTANAVGQFVRVQLQNKNFLHFAQVEVFGVYSAFKYVGKVGAVQCSTDATLVIMSPISTQSVLDDYYLRAIQADADHASILRQYDAYERSFRKFGRGTAETLDGPCRLCRVFRDCEICEFYASAKYSRRAASDNGQKPLPVRLVGDRMGLKELVQVAMAEGTLEAEQQEQLRQEQEAADIAREAEASGSLIGSGSFSKVYKCIKKIDGWVYAVKKSKRHFRGKADTKKMVHMDVKLQNVLVGPGEVYKLGDLGTVAHLDGSMEITEGDNRYLSRNNLRAGDIFALGATIYELALGTTLASGGEEWQKIRDGDLVMFRDEPIITAFFRVGRLYANYGVVDPEAKLFTLKEAKAANEAAVKTKST